MQVIYSPKAQSAGIYVLEACGFDSIPSEMGLLHSKKQFDGRCHSLIACHFHTFAAFRSHCWRESFLKMKL